MTVDPNGFDCTCGKRGCLETVSSATGVVRVARHLSEEFAGDSELKQAIDDGQDVSSKDVLNLPKRRSFCNGCGSCLLLFGATGNLGNTLNPDSVVIGGGVSAAGEFLRSRVEKYFQEFTFRKFEIVQKSN